MKKTYNAYLKLFLGIAIILLIISLIVFYADNKKMYAIKQNTEELKIQKKTIQSQVDWLEKNINAIPNDSVKTRQEEQLNELKKELAELEYKLSEQTEKNYETLKSLWTHQIEYWSVVIAILVGIIFFSSLEHLAREKMEKEIAKITGRELQTIKANYDEYIKHKNLRKDSKIVVLAKDKNFDKVFKKIMALFYVDLNNDVITINDPFNLKEVHYKKFKYADVVLIENYDEANFWDMEIYKQAFINLANNLNHNTSIFYYGMQGKGYFPSEQVKKEIRHLISFANTPPQLYGNLLNLLKYRAELGIGPKKHNS